MIIDISQEVFSCKVYPGDPEPEYYRLESIEDGELYNLSAFSMCTHNGTHIDAPNHFLESGKTIEEIGLEACVGDCYVACHEGDVTKIDAEQILEKAQSVQAGERILIAGKAVVTEEAAEVFAKAKVKL